MGPLVLLWFKIILLIELDWKVYAYMSRKTRKLINYMFGFILLISLGATEILH